MESATEKGQSYFKCSHLDLKRKNITKEEKKSKKKEKCINIC